MYFKNRNKIIKKKDQYCISLVVLKDFSKLLEINKISDFTSHKDSTERIFVRSKDKLIIFTSKIECIDWINKNVNPKYIPDEYNILGLPIDFYIK